MKSALTALIVTALVAVRFRGIVAPLGDALVRDLGWGVFVLAAVFLILLLLAVAAWRLLLALEPQQDAGATTPIDTGRALGAPPAADSPIRSAKPSKHRTP